MKADQKYVDRLINTAITFGTGIPSSVNRELVDNGYDPLPDMVILQRAAVKLAESVFKEEE